MDLDALVNSSDKAQRTSGMLVSHVGDRIRDLYKVWSGDKLDKVFVLFIHFCILLYVIGLVFVVTCITGGWFGF